MFGFPTDLFGMHGGNNRRSNTNSLIPHNQSLFGNSMMLPSPFVGMNSLFGDFGMNSSPFTMMDRMMRAVSNPLFLEENSSTTTPMHSFTSTTVMSFNGTDGRPKVYQESTSHSRGPGGLEQTRQSIRDSERGINKVQIGHRIGDRKHVIEREMNVETGQISENIELENLDEDETDNFKQEWRERSVRIGHPRHAYHPFAHRHQHHHQALPSNRSYHSSHQPQLALEHHSSTGSNRHHQRSEKNSSNRVSSQPSDTIDLTNDSPIIEVIDSPSPSQPQIFPGKRKASSSSSNGLDTQRKHRQNRF